MLSIIWRVVYDKETGASLSASTTRRIRSSRCNSERHSSISGYFRTFTTFTIDDTLAQRLQHYLVAVGLTIAGSIHECNILVYYTFVLVKQMCLVPDPRHKCKAASPSGRRISVRRWFIKTRILGDVINHE